MSNNPAMNWNKPAGINNTAMIVDSKGMISQYKHAEEKHAKQKPNVPTPVIARVSTL
jgi:hypothetical protein